LSVITWKNVNSKNNNDAAYLMRGAQSSITGGLDRLAGVAQGIEQNEQDNYNIVKDNNTNAFKDMMAGFNTQEELDAAVNSGAVQRMADSFGAQADQSVLRDGVTNRKNTIRDRFTADQDFLTAQQGFQTEQQNFEDTQDTLALRPVLDALATAQLGTTPADDATFEKLMTENKTEFNRLGLTQGLRKSFNESQITESDLVINNRKKADDKRAQDSKDLRERAQREIVKVAELDENNRPNIQQARARALQLIASPDFAGMSAEDRQQLVNGVGIELAQNFGITEDQLKQSEMVLADARVTQDKELSGAKAVYDDVLSMNQVNEEFSFDDAIGMPQINTLANEMGWDKEAFAGAGDNLNEELLNIRKTFKAGVGKEQSEAVIDNLFYKALGAMGPAGQGEIAPDGDERRFTFVSDLPIESITNEMERLLDSYQSNITARATRTAAKKAYDTQVETANLKPSKAYQEKLDTFRKSNVDATKLVEAANRLKVPPRKDS